MSTDEVLLRRIANLEAEVGRLRAKEQVLATFNQYLYSLDTAFGPRLMDTYSETCVLDVINFPPDGVDMHFEGREAMEPLYKPYGEAESLITGGHNATNVAIVISDDATEATVSAYFTTTRPKGVQGGRYEGTMRLEDDGVWRWIDLAIISAWGWTAETNQISDPVPVERSRFGGHPASDVQ